LRALWFVMCVQNKATRSQVNDHQIGVITK
jgi:hypothetical protein